MLKKTACAVAATMLALGLAACEVHQTDGGQATAPQSPVDKTQQGSAKASSYDLKTPDVTVTMQEKTIEVPVIRKEERIVRIPEINVKPADDNKNEKQVPAQ